MGEEEKDKTTERWRNNVSRRELPAERVVVDLVVFCLMLRLNASSPPCHNTYAVQYSRLVFFSRVSD